MKKLVFTIVSVLGVSLMHVNAQDSGFKVKERLSLGIKAEANASNFILSDLDDAKSEMGFGGGAGVFMKLDLSKHFAIQEDIMFTYFTSELTMNGIKDTYRYLGAEVPIYLMGQWNTPAGGRIYGGVGPYFGMGLKAELEDSDVDLYKKTDGEAFMKKISYGAAAQIGYELNSGLQFNASYKIGANVLDANKDDFEMLPQSVSIGIGYRF